MFIRFQEQFLIKQLLQFYLHWNTKLHFVFKRNHIAGERPV